MKNIFLNVGELRKKLTPSCPSLQLLFHGLLCLLAGGYLTLAVQLVTLQSGSRLVGWVLAHGGQALTTALFLGLLIAVLGFLLRSLFAGGALVTVLTLVLAFVSYFKVLIVGTPLEITDFFLAGNLGGIGTLAGDYLRLSYQSALAILGALPVLFVLWFFTRPLRPKLRRGLISCICALALFGTLFCTPLTNTFFYGPFSTSLHIRIGQIYANDQCGVVLGLWRSALLRSGLAMKDYNPQRMEEVLAQTKALAAPPAPTRQVQPNIVLLLSESFFDATKLPNLTFGTDPLENFHALQAEGVSGKFRTRTLGYGTGNIELELLSGLNTRYFLSASNLCYLPPDDYSKIPAVPQLLRESGYDTVMLHTFDDALYNRRANMQAMGFEKTYFTNDLPEIDPAFAAGGDDYAADKLSGAYYSDDYFTDLLLAQYQQKPAGTPIFLYGISMENHSPYNQEKYGGVCDWSFTSPVLDAEATAAAESLVQGLGHADQALGKLTDYFRQQEEPTVVIFYGDHRPGITLKDGDTLYSRLGACNGTNMADWTMAQLGELYSTDYLIWSNDPTLLPEAAGTHRDTSSNYLGLDVLDAAGVAQPLYWRYLRSLQQITPICTDVYFTDKAGTTHASIPYDLPDEERNALSLMDYLIYDAFYGKNYVTEALGGTD
ncbi:MAG: LTA synthase family protein [Pseudoflavonifractor sp.]